MRQVPRDECADSCSSSFWWSLALQLEVTARVPGNRFSRAVDEHWIDPVLGLRGQVFLTPEWSLYGSGNVGGFGLVSNFTWGLKGGVGYHFNDSIALHHQYKAIGVDYNNDKTSGFSVPRIR